VLIIYHVIYYRKNKFILLLKLYSCTW